MYETSNYIYKVLNDKTELLNENGLLILPFPTGIGKTFNIIRFIKENYKKKKMFFVSNQLKLLPSLEKITENVSSNEKKEISNEYLEIPSLLESFKKYIYDISSDAPFTGIEEFKDIKETILAYDNSKEQDAKVYFLDKFYNLERVFRTKLKNKIKNNQYLEKYRAYIKQLYPATMLDEKKL